MEPVFEKTFPIRSYEVDFRGLAGAFTLVNLLQESAGEHSALLGVSLPDLLPKGLTWVLSRYHIRVGRYPFFGEKVGISTWPAERVHKGTIRDFEVRDEGGAIIARASSSFVLLDLESKRPVRLDDHLPPYPLTPRRALDTDFPLPQQLSRPELELPFRVRMSDLDLNRHVNNAIYVAWAVETVPEAFLRSFLPVEMEISFRAEAFYGDRILSRSEALEGENGAVFLHQLVREADGQELTRLKTRWEPHRHSAKNNEEGSR